MAKNETQVYMIFVNDGWQEVETTETKERLSQHSHVSAVLTMDEYKAMTAAKAKAEVKTEVKAEVDESPKSEVKKNGANHSRKN